MKKLNKEIKIKIKKIEKGQKAAKGENKAE